MQSKLAKWSTEDKTRKFDRLLRMITSKDWLRAAADRTLRSSGAKTPGVDGIDRKIFSENEVVDFHPCLQFQHGRVIDETIDVSTI
jgi:retron-type reverse transcriptase